jgi:hypothetical protein
VIDALPIEELKRVVKDKLINSPEFRKLVEVLVSPELKVNIQQLDLVLEMLRDPLLTIRASFS